MSLREMAEEALKKAVARVVEEHRRSGEPLVVWRDGEVVHVPADQLQRPGGDGNRSSPGPRSKMSYPRIIFKKVHPVHAYFYLIILNLTLTCFHLPTVQHGGLLRTEDYEVKESYDQAEW